MDMAGEDGALSQRHRDETKKYGETQRDKLCEKKNWRRVHVHEYQCGMLIFQNGIYFKIKMMKKGIGRIQKTNERDLLVYHENPTYLKPKDNEIFFFYYTNLRLVIP